MEADNFLHQQTSTAGRKSKVKSQKSKRRQHKIVGDLEWLVYLRRAVLVPLSWN